MDTGITGLFLKYFSHNRCGMEITDKMDGKSNTGLCYGSGQRRFWYNFPLLTVQRGNSKWITAARLHKEKKNLFRADIFLWSVISIVYTCTVTHTEVCRVWFFSTAPSPTLSLGMYTMYTWHVYFNMLCELDSLYPCPPRSLTEESRAQCHMASWIKAMSTHSPSQGWISATHWPFCHCHGRACTYSVPPQPLITQTRTHTH